MYGFVSESSRTIIASLMDRELQADKARMAELIERARLQRQHAVAKGTSPATSDTQFFLIAAE